ncbi:MAG TPA: Trm112 family protein [Myxococcota bacterium]|nr:Trm112 family protein [Myxococcota bacterium]
MAVSQELLEILVCPETKQPIALAAPDVLARVNAEIDAGRLRNRGGEAVKTRITEGLIRQDGRILYPVDDGIPVMLIDESIELT